MENFELPLARLSSTLLIGKNGARKTTVGIALEILQRIGRGTSRVVDLVWPNDFTRGRFDAPMRLEVEVLIQQTMYRYAMALECPKEFKEPRVLEEKLSVDGKPVFSRELAQVRLARMGPDIEASFRIDWHLVALPIVQEQSSSDPIFIFKQWLARMLILRPVPSLMGGDSRSETLQPNIQVTDVSAWFSGLPASAPSAYATIDDFLKSVMPDLVDINEDQLDGLRQAASDILF